MGGFFWRALWSFLDTCATAGAIVINPLGGLVPGGGQIAPPDPSAAEHPFELPPLLVRIFIAAASVLLQAVNTHAPPPGYCDAMRGAGISNANQSAAGLVSQMTPEEKSRLLRGVGYTWLNLAPGYYTGNLLGVPRLGIPSIHMNDAHAGFRTTRASLEFVGVPSQDAWTATSWPSALALASTWDRALTRAYARAVATEFKTKGANVLLGPGIEVVRVARGGRNAEMLSGEDPVLGEALGAAYVQAAQEMGVAVVAKHFALNQQETNRMAHSAVADDRVLMELYYRPFEGVIRAGVAGVMCAYQKVNGTYACGNRELIQDHLRGRLGFRGFVTSDWWAYSQFNRSLGGVVDLEMPGNQLVSKRRHSHDINGGDPVGLGYFRGREEVALGDERRDAAATRLLAAMLKVGALASPVCAVGCDCREVLERADATSGAHTRLARRVGAEATVLLKNEGALLPLTAEGTVVALVGSACDAYRTLTNAPDYYAVGGSGRVVSPRSVSIADALALRGVRVRPSFSDSLPAALDAAVGADVVVACGGAATKEETDRASLRLDQHDFLVSLGKALEAPLVVLAVSPGALVVEPWVGRARAVLALFLGGQETGHAFADVLLGNVNPAARLPVTLPRREEDTVPPCLEAECRYEEGLDAGWRGLVGKAVSFPFGHGLSYTLWSYSWDTPPAPSTDGALEMAVRIGNVGARAGAEVVQLYLHYPESSGEARMPPLLLRAFHKTGALAPGQAEVVRFALSPRDMSYWKSGRGWTLVHGVFTLHVGASSRDLRLTASFKHEPDAGRSGLRVLSLRHKVGTSTKKHDSRARHARD